MALDYSDASGRRRNAACLAAMHRCWQAAGPAVRSLADVAAHAGSPHDPQPVPQENPARTGICRVPGHCGAIPAAAVLRRLGRARHGHRPLRHDLAAPRAAVPPPALRRAPTVRDFSRRCSISSSRTWTARCARWAQATSPCPRRSRRWAASSTVSSARIDDALDRDDVAAARQPSSSATSMAATPSRSAASSPPTSRPRPRGSTRSRSTPSSAALALGDAA